MHQAFVPLHRWRRRPGFALVAVLTLTVAFGALAAIFSVVDAVLLRPLPYDAPDRLVTVEHQAPGLGLDQLGMSKRLLAQYREAADSFVDLGLYDEGMAAVSGLERPVEATAARVTPSLLRILRREPARGRACTEQEGMPAGEAVAIVSHGFWQGRLGGAPDVLERTIEVDGVGRRIVGVMAPDFAFPSSRTEIWIPAVIDPDRDSLGAFGSRGIARLRDGVDLQTAALDLSRFTDDLEGRFPGDGAATVLSEARFGALLVPLSETIVGPVRPLLWAFFATAVFVLLVAALNVATLVVARSDARQREDAVRSALGARRSTLARMALGEGLALSTTAGVLGLGLGHLALGPLLGLAPGRLPRIDEIGLDARTMSVVMILALASGTLFGLIPVMRAPLGDLASTLGAHGRSATGGHQAGRVRRVLVAAQMAIAIMLGIGAGLTARSYQRLTAVDPGFRADQAIAFRLALPVSKAPGDTDAARFYDSLLGRLAALPGVDSAASASAIPLSGRGRESGHRLADEVARGEGELPTVFSLRQVSPGYFRTMGIPLIAGRPIERADFEQRRGVVVVSRALAERYWPGESALGKRLFPGRPADDEGWLEVVGVAADTRDRQLGDPAASTVYYPWLTPEADMLVARDQTVVLRTATTDPTTVLDAVRRTVWSLDPDLPLAGVTPLTDVVRDARARMRFTALLAALAAAVALSLGAIGTYGVIAYLVGRRRREIGIRMALGAERARVVRMVVGEGLGLAAAGSVAGLIAAAGLTRFLRALLFEVPPRDPLVFAGVAVAVLAVAAAACLLPARTAAGIDPAIALRHD